MTTPDDECEITGFVFNTRKEDEDFPCPCFELWMEIFAEEDATDEQVSDACACMTRNVTNCSVTEVHSYANEDRMHTEPQQDVKYTLTHELDPFDKNFPDSPGYPHIHPVYPVDSGRESFIGWRIIVSL